LNGGAFLRENGREIALHVSEEREPALMTIAISRSHHTADVDRACKRLGITRLGITRSIAFGSLGLKVGMICGGQAHLYIHPGPETSLWDTCAANAILTEAGGKMTSCDGTPLRYNPPDLRHTRGVVASTGVIHDRIVEAISDVRAITGR
jgi:3'(2'), 5'-bisphosphate nucleotidase